MRWPCLPEVALLYGMVNLSFALADALGRGFDLFSRQVRTGEFDRLLLRPRSTALQVMGQEFTLFRVGRFAQGGLAGAWALSQLGVAWSWVEGFFLVCAILGGAALFLGLFVLQATLCFWTVEGLEIMNTVTYGGVETASYPLGIYQEWFRGFFTWVVPLACVNYLPIHVLLGRPGPPLLPFWGELPPALLWLSPLGGFLFLALAFRVWRLGEGRYCSTGS